MSLRVLFAINFWFILFFGLACVFMPLPLHAAYGLTANPPGIWTTRLLGGSFLGFATLMWFGWHSAAVEARRAIALALLVQDVVGLLASGALQLSGQIGVVGWSNVILYGAFALGYAWFLVLGTSRL